MGVEERSVVAPLLAEVPMVEADVVKLIHGLKAAGLGKKRIAAQLGLARNTVRRYLTGGEAALKQERPTARCLDEAAVKRAIELWEGIAEGNAAVVQSLMASEGVEASLRTVERAVAPRRQEVRAAEVATVRFETAPGRQMQVDFGEKMVSIAGQLVKVHLLVAVLSHSRRLFVRAFLRQRGDDWREGIADAFLHFGGVPQELLGDNAKALVVDRDRQAGTVRFHPAYLAFCREWDVQPRACGPYRARTKGKTESGVKYVKRNALAGRAFESFAALEAHLAAWMVEADNRVHGTTHEKPSVRFERDEKSALRPLPSRPPPRRRQELRRRVAPDALVDVDTVRYSVPHRLVREHVQVLVTDEEVHISHGGVLVAKHVRGREPFARVVDMKHWEGLWRPHEAPVVETGQALQAMGRCLADYVAVVERGAA